MRAQRSPVSCLRAHSSGGAGQDFEPSNRAGAQAGHHGAVLLGWVCSFPGLGGTHSQQEGEARDGLYPSWLYFMPENAPSGAQLGWGAAGWETGGTLVFVCSF